MSLLEEQYQLIEEVDQLWSNYRKDGKDRKSKLDYYEKRYETLNELWKVIQVNHERIGMEISRTDPYFTDKCYDRVTELYNTFKHSITSGYEQLKLTLSAPKVDGRPTTPKTPVGTLEAGRQLQPPASPHQQEHPTIQESMSRFQFVGERSRREVGNFSKLDEALRKQEANFRAFARSVSNIKIDSLSEKWEFEDALKTLETRWSAVDGLHWEIDSELNGKDLSYEASFTKYEDQFNTLKKDINKKMWSVSYREKSTPKLDIPIFFGNYNNWVSFKDLFTDAIHNNSSMPNSQKMQILKTKLKGEAERLIQHLEISSENYASCWEILNHRYNNKKLIFTSQMNVLFQLPNTQYNSLSQIKRMHDSTIETLNAIKNLGVDTTTWDPILVHLLTQKMDSETYSEYLESVKDKRELPVLKELLEFLESRFTNLETSSRRKQEPTPEKQQHFSNKKKSIVVLERYLRKRVCCEIIQRDRIHMSNV